MIWENTIIGFKFSENNLNTGSFHFILNKASLMGME
jgi:hypothetical protein